MRHMNVQPLPGASERVNEIRSLTAQIVNREILPNENLIWAEHRAGTHLADSDHDLIRKTRDHIETTVRQAGLWAPHLPTEYGGAGLDFLELAYMYEVLSYATGAAALFGVVAPNSGNEQILVKYGTEDQKQRWLLPLIAGEMESGFSMTEPDQPGSDPRSLRTTARRDGDEWVINGHKWFTSNGRRADFFIVMCRTANDGDVDRNSAMTQIIVPADTPGVNIVRGVNVWGHDSDHCEIIYDDVRVPVDNALGALGTGHQAAQDRLGAGRVYHCMNSIGQMWRAFDLMVERAMTREVHGGLLESKQMIQQFVADSYMDIQAARLMTIDCAEKLAAGSDARTDISSIKVFVPAAFHRVVDRAIQVWGAAGVTGDLPLAHMYLAARTLRLADGPDEVHRILIAKNVFAGYRGTEAGWDFGS